MDWDEGVEEQVKRLSHFSKEAQLRRMVDGRVMVIIDHPNLREESAHQQNWGYIQRFDDRCFVVKLEEGVFDYWVFENCLIPDDWAIIEGDKLVLTGTTPGYKAWAVRGPDSGDIVERLLKEQKTGGQDGKNP